MSSPSLEWPAHRAYTVPSYDMQPTLAPAPQPRTAQQPPNQPDNASEQALRERLLADVQTGNLPNFQQHRPEPPPNQHPQYPPHPQNHNIDPAIAGSGVMGPYPAPGPDGSPGGEARPPRGNAGRRELSSSKRAAQNRAAQRAFRQRKEGHIKELELQVGQLHEVSGRFQHLQSENAALKGYVISLQAELLQKAGRFPPPPPHINIQPNDSNAPPAEGAQPHDGAMNEDQNEANGQAPTAPMRSYENDLQNSAAQAVAEQQNGNHDPQLQDAGPAKRQRTTSPPRGS